MPAAVYIPGTLCDARVFGPMAERLGWDAHFATPVTHDNVEEEAAALLAWAPARFVAIGFSLGGFVTLELLRKAPERLFGAVLIASNSYALQPGGAETRRADLALARAEGVGSVIARLWPRYVAGHRQGDLAMRSLVEDMADRVGVERFAAQTELAIDRPDSRDTIQSTCVPLLVLNGAEDALSPPGAAQGFAKGPTVRIIELASVGHFVPLEAPDAAAAAVATWSGELTLCC